MSKRCFVPLSVGGWVENINDINDYVIQDDDRILITFGNETPEQIEEQLIELDSQVIKG